MENMPDIKAFPEAQLVMKGDLFVVDKLSGQVIKHESTDKSSTDTSKLEDIIASYQQVYWKNGVINSVILYKADLLKAKSKSKAQSEAGFWAQWPGEACKKVATNRAFRLYHKYPDGIVTFGKDEDKTEEATYEDASSTNQPEQPEQPQQAEVPTVQVEEVKEPVRKQAGKNSGMNALLEEDWCRYLDNPIKIDGIEIRHTVYGLKNMLDLYENMLKTATREQLGDKERQHIENHLIPTYKLHLKLYGE